MKPKISLLEKLREIVMLIRIQQLGTSVTAVIGALTVTGLNLGLSDFLLLFLVGVLLNISGQVHNDLKDIKIDSFSKELVNRPLVKGSVSIKTAWIIVLSGLVLSVLLTLIFYRNILSVVVIFIAIIFGFLYNSYSKKIPGADFFLSAGMAFLFLFGAVAVSGNLQSLQELSILTWILFVLVFIHVFLMDALGGGLKDAKNDRDAGAKTLAVFLGVKANDELHIPLSYKFIIMFFEFLTVVFAVAPFLFFDISFSYLQIVVLVLLIIGMVFSTVILLNMKIFDRKKIKYHNRNHELFGYCIVPVVLMESIGYIWIAILILLPMIWFIVFNFILYRDSWANPKND